MCKAFCDRSASVADKFAALSKATLRHRNISMDAIMGKGVDRHLFALQKWHSVVHGSAPLPAIFTDPGYATFKDIRLSTSTLASPALAGGGFGPVSPHSYAIGYGIEERGAHFHIMNYEHSTTDHAGFIGAVETTLYDFHNVITEAKAQGLVRPVRSA